MERHVPELIRTQNWQELRAELADANSSDIADLIIALPPDQEAFVFRLLPRVRRLLVSAAGPPGRVDRVAVERAGALGDGVAAAGRPHAPPRGDAGRGHADRKST